MEQKIRFLKKGEIVFAAGEQSHTLFFIDSGKLLVFSTEGTRVNPLGTLEKGEYLGELSFFDQQPRSAHVICLEDTNLVQISVEELNQQFPQWVVTIAQNIAQKLRAVDELVAQKEIRKKNDEAGGPLSMEDQRTYYQALENYQNK